MIGKFFGWLGSKIAEFIGWLGSLLYQLFQVFLTTVQNCLDWLYETLVSLAETILEYVLTLVPNMDPGNVSSALSFMRRAWNTFDVFVPLHEGLVFVSTYFGVYLTVKLTALIIRVVLGLIP